MKENIFRLSEELLERKDFRALKQLLAGIAPHSIRRNKAVGLQSSAAKIARRLPQRAAGAKCRRRHRSVRRRNDRPPLPDLL